MKDRSRISAVRAALLRRSTWTCLSLAFFLIYNPFVASAHAIRGLGVCHPVSHRATVGASELQHFSPAAGWDSRESADIAALEVPQFLPVLTSSFFVAIPRVSPPPQQFFGPGRWFRPPPAR